MSDFYKEVLINEKIKAAIDHLKEINLHGLDYHRSHNEQLLIRTMEVLQDAYENYFGKPSPWVARKEEA